ncbi:MAG: InlB B-repeat-containing protein, partial [Bryobacteraceae bacterium]
MKLLIAIIAILTPALAVDITLATNPPGFNLIVDGVATPTPQVVNWTPGSSHSIGAVSPQTTGLTRRIFASWSDGGAQTHEVVAPGTPVTFTASFRAQHALTLIVSPPGGGTVAASPPSDGGFYDAGAVVQLTAIPAAGSAFKNFTGPVSGASPLLVTMSAPIGLTANFTCGFTLSTTNGSFGTGASTSSVDVLTTGSNCAWTAASNAPWIAVLSGANSAGTGAASFSIAPNTTNAARVGTLSVAGQTFTVNQTAGFGLGLFKVGQFLLDINNNRTFDGPLVDRQNQFGLGADLPAVGDWNGTGSAKLGVFRDGAWYLDLNNNGVLDAGDRTIANFGTGGDFPVAGDWDGSGAAKVAVYRRGAWFFDLNGNGQWDGTPADGFFANFGIPTDLPVVGDWNGSGKTKIGVFRGGSWFLDLNGNGQWEGPGIDGFIPSFGFPGDRPVA